MRDEMRERVAQLVRLLAEGEYERVESLTHGIRLPAKQIRAAVEEYGRTLIALPPEAFDLMDVTRVGTEDAGCWSIVVPLWSKEEGRSDLSIELTLIKGSSGLEIELDDIHVL